MNIGKAIKEVRKKTRLNQQEFCNRIKITQTYLSQIENGKKTPSLDILQKIAIAVEIPLGILFWFSIEEVDVKSHLSDHFKLLKPNIDNLISTFIVEK